MFEQKLLCYKFYNQFVGGWGVVGVIVRVLLQQSVIGKGLKVLLVMNQFGGFKCFSCVFFDVDECRKLEFCENGVKVLVWEVMEFWVGCELFVWYIVIELMVQIDYWLEMQGWLIELMCYDVVIDYYVLCSWDDVFVLIGCYLQVLDSLYQVEFYIFGCMFNEVVFLYLIFVCEFGINNFLDCLNMCYELISCGLLLVIGVGKGIIVLQDFEYVEVIFVIGQNIGINLSWMMSNLVEVCKCGILIVVVNLMFECVLICFVELQDVVQMVMFGLIEIISEFVYICIGGDLVLIKGMMKVMFECEVQGECVFDYDFLLEYMVGLEVLCEDVMVQDWDQIVQVFGILLVQICCCVEIYICFKVIVICYGMGLIQYQYGLCLLQQVVNLLLLCGNFGKFGVGIGLICGYFNVQGDCIVGIDEKFKLVYFDCVQQVFGFDLLCEYGYYVVEFIEVMLVGSVKVFIGLGGNFIYVVFDMLCVYEVMCGLDLIVGIVIKFNCGYLVYGCDVLILLVVVCLESIVMLVGEQFVIIEDVMFNVIVLCGVFELVSVDVLFEVEIVCWMVLVMLLYSKVDWICCMYDYVFICELIVVVYLEIYIGFNECIQQLYGFYLDILLCCWVWFMFNGKVNILVMFGLDVDDFVYDLDMLWLVIVCLYDQYNIIIYSYNDCYCGVYNDCMVLFMNIEDWLVCGLEKEVWVILEMISGDGVQWCVEGLMVLDYLMLCGVLVGYYFELNFLLLLDYYDCISGMLVVKLILVWMWVMVVVVQQWMSLILWVFGMWIGFIQSKGVMEIVGCILLSVNDWFLDLCQQFMGFEGIIGLVGEVCE